MITHKFSCKKITNRLQIRRNFSQHKLKFLSQTKPNIDNVVQEIGTIIAINLTPNVVKQPCNDSNHTKIFGLPVKHSALKILAPDERVDISNQTKTACGSLSHSDLPTIKIDQQLEINNIRK